MAQQRTDILLPPGRLVQGSIYKPRTTDAEGKPLVVKVGPDAGKPRVDFYLAVAIPKTPGQTHWNQTEWGAKIFAAGAAAFPQQHLSRDFAWKIEDGDSTEVNKKGRRPSDNEGWRGNWVVKASGGYAPKTYQRNAGGQIEQVDTPDFIKPGYYVQLSGNVSGNGSVTQPGIYVNHGMVLFLGYGPEIYSGPDANAVFGAAPAALPPGASAVPAGVTAMPVAAPTPPVIVPPAPGFLAPPLPPAAPVRRLTAKAAGATYEQLIGAGWTDALLVSNGLMEA